MQQSKPLHTQFQRQDAGYWSRQAWVWVCIVGLGLWHSTMPPNAAASPALPQRNGEAELSAAQTQLLKTIHTARIIYLGETHDHEPDHRAELTILQGLYRFNPQLVVAMEMFQRPYQPAIDRYLQGSSSETDLLEGTQFQQRWGYNWSFYAPIVRFAQKKGLPVLAINAPTETTRKVARFGLEALTPEDTAWTPPAAEIETHSPSYRQRLQDIFNSFHQGKGNSKGFEHFVQAQALWDETMADAIAQYHVQNPQRQIVVLVGQGHLWADGLPSRVGRRLKQIQGQNIQQEIVLLNPPQSALGEPLQGTENPRKWVWITADRSCIRDNC
ncbi:MAG TPA: ChaN family lipoprotein [Stenomitos sp.]